MVAEDRERLRGDRAGGDVEHRRGQLARDLVHVGNHQEQALRRGEGRRQCPTLKRSMDRARRARLALHLDHVGHAAPKIGVTLARPLIGQLGHRRGWRDRVDRTDLVDPIGDVGRGLVTVDRGHGTAGAGRFRPLNFGLLGS